MERKNFITSALIMTTAVASAKTLMPNTAKKLPKKPFFVKAGDDRFNEHIMFHGVNFNDIKVSTKDTDGQFCVYEYVGLGKVGPPLHVHLNQDEFFYITEGSFLFQVGDEREIMKAGDTVFLPRNIPHTWLQLTDKGKLIYLVQPAGKMEAFFSKMSSFKTIPTQEEVSKVFAAHELRLVGPPLTAD